jgi:outer membrane receptor for monomeric catechols
LAKSTVEGFNFYVGIVTDEGRLLMTYAPIRLDHLIEDLFKLAAILRLSISLGEVIGMVMVPVTDN